MSQNNTNNSQFHPQKFEDEIVISGIAGRFPNSDNVQLLQENLMNKVDLISDDDRRWITDHPKIPQRTGKINNIEKFDALFFGVHAQQAHSMDPMSRMLLEHAYEAVVDAGINPKKIQNSKTGVFIGTSIIESEQNLHFENQQFDSYVLSGVSRSMFANRISYFFNLTGPSQTIDTACSSSCAALELAYRSIREGVCDAAIVGGTNLCLNPNVSLHFFKLGVLSADGRCKSFDERANGYVRSETIGIVFLQKAKDAKRIYASIVHAKCNSDGFKEEGILYLSSNKYILLLNEFYTECGVSPSSVNYIEAHCAGTQVGDFEEMNAVDTFFASDKFEPLLIGSVKSNLGHSEAASGMCSLIKIIIAMETGIIPPNINYAIPRKVIKPIIEGRIKVITEPTQWKNNYASINSFGFGGTKAHILLKSNTKEKINKGIPDDDLPRLVVASGRTQEAVSIILDYLESKPVDVEFIKLLHDIQSEEIRGHLYRGYTLLATHRIFETPIRQIQNNSRRNKQLCFVFSGMGGQWPGMGEALLKLPVFFKAINNCHIALKPHGINIFHILSSKDEAPLDNILNSFVGIAAVQIGLVDILTSIGIKPNYIIGHSLGELGCAYADGCLTAEQMIMAAYFRGKVSIETDTIFGLMAAVGLGYQKLKDLCPADIEVACHNSIHNTTISGPAESVETFVDELKVRNIFVKKIFTGNIAFHTSYIANMKPKLSIDLKKIISKPKLRSKKWLSTSVPIDKWDSQMARFSSAEYFINNTLSPVLFEETFDLLPKNITTIEISPHGLLQAVLRDFGSDFTNIALTQRNHGDNLQFLLQAIGRIFMSGFHPQIANLYPSVQYPVSRGTPMISPLIKWEHSENWFITSFRSNCKDSSIGKLIDVSLSSNSYKYLNDYIIDGKTLYPPAGYLLLIWELFASIHGAKFTELAVVFKDIRFLRILNFPKNGAIKFEVSIQKGTGKFEIHGNGMTIIIGTIGICSNLKLEKLGIERNSTNFEEEIMQSCDVYKEFEIRGYQYTGLFQSIKSATATGSKGHITWNNNWTVFIENMLQLQILSEDSRCLFMPTAIEKIVIDPKLHTSLITTKKDKFDFSVYTNKLFSSIVSGGIEICGVQIDTIPRKKIDGELLLQQCQFVPYINDDIYNLDEIMSIIIHIIFENIKIEKLKIVEIVEETDQFCSLLCPIIFGKFHDFPSTHPDLKIFCTKDYFQTATFPPEISTIDPKTINTNVMANLIIGRQLLTTNRIDDLDLLHLELKHDGFILSRESLNESEDIQKEAENKGFSVILIKKCEKEMFVLFKKQITMIQEHVIVNVSNENFNWINIQNILKEQNEKNKDKTLRILLIRQGISDSDMSDVINCLRQEPNSEIIRSILVQDFKAPKFSLQNPLYAKQIEKDLTISVLRENCCWGSYRYLPLDTPKQKSVGHALVSQSTFGDLNTLMWIEGPIQIDNQNDIINVIYAAINFKDIMIASGKLPVKNFLTDRREQDFVLGLEFSGIDSSGKRKMGFVKNRGLTNIINFDPIHTFDVPDSWSLEDAATVPYAYATCYYALNLKGKLKKGEKVLIHTGSGSIGQAAINLCLHEDCEIFTTVGTAEKRQFIREHFPQIRDDHIGNSRDTSFVLMIMEQTSGRGVDIVLNNLIEEKLQASMKCLTIGGRFLDIGKHDVILNNSLNMKYFMHEISFQAIFMDAIFSKSKEEKLNLSNLINDGIKKGAVKPLVRTVYLKDQIETMFRCMTAGEHIGKVLIKLQEDQESLNQSILAIPRFYGLKECSYVVLNGLGEFGLEFVDWLIIRGVKNIIITSSSKINNGYQKSRINLWKKYKAQIVIITNKDIAHVKNCQFIMETAMNFGPIDGIFNLEMLLTNHSLENETADSYKKLCDHQLCTIKNFDILTRKMCPTLRYFVIASATFYGKENINKIYYSSSISMIKRLCEQRKLESLPGLTLHFGALEDNSLLINKQKNQKKTVDDKIITQRISSCLQVLDQLLLQNQPIVSSMIVADKTSAVKVTTPVDTILEIMGIRSLKEVNSSLFFADLGIDSIIGLQVQQILQQDCNIHLNFQEIRSLSFTKLQEILQIV